MNKILLDQLEQSKKRLTFYSSLKTKTGPKTVAIDKWIEIYSERVRKIERQIQKTEKVEKLGLRTQVGKKAEKSAARA